MHIHTRVHYTHTNLIYTQNLLKLGKHFLLLLSIPDACNNPSICLSVYMILSPQGREGNNEL